MDYQMQLEAKKIYGEDFIGNVIRITNNRTIIVNAGKSELSVGDKIQIYEPGEILKDIDGRELCAFNYIKEELEVIQTEEHYSVCKKMEYINKTFNFVLSPLLETTKTEYIPMNIDETDIKELKPKDTKVRVGDPIKLA